MRIGIEAQRIFRAKKHGMDFVAINYIIHLVQQPEISELVVFTKRGEVIPELQNLEKITWVFIPNYPYPIWEQFVLPFYTRKYNIELLHCTSSTAPLLYFKKLVTTVHDIIYLESNPFNGGSLYQRLGNLYRTVVVPKVIRKSMAVVTVSGFEKTNMAKSFPQHAHKIQVIYNAANASFSKMATESDISGIKAEYNLPDKYALFLGNTDPKKNVDKTLKAYFKAVRKNAAVPKLVLPDYPLHYMQRWFLENGVAAEEQKRIVLCDYIPNDDIHKIMSGAKFFLYTSVRESFGIPVLEAFLSKTLLITSHTGSIPEIAESNALYVDPLNVDDMSNKMLMAMEMKDVSRLQMIEAAYKSAHYFDWKISAEKLVILYSKLYT